MPWVEPVQMGSATGLVICDELHVARSGIVKRDRWTPAALVARHISAGPRHPAPRALAATNGVGSARKRHLNEARRGDLCAYRDDSLWVSGSPLCVRLENVDDLEELGPASGPLPPDG